MRKHGGGDLAMLELLDRVHVAQMQLLHLDVERVEQQVPGNGGAASRLAEIYHLTVQLLDVGYPRGHHKVDLLVEQLRDVDHLVDEIRAELSGPRVIRMITHLEQAASKENASRASLGPRRHAFAARAHCRRGQR